VHPGGAPVPRWLLVTAGLLSCAPVLAYFALLFDVSSNLPYLDDYDVILHFLNESQASESLAEQLRLVFSQHAEHRMAFLRGLALASLSLQGAVDFDLLNQLGSVGLLLLAALLFTAAGRDGASPAQRLVAFTPVPLLLFQPQFWDCLLWPTSSLANFWVVAFALGSLLLADCASGAGRLAGAGALAVLATFSQGNGMLVWPLVALVLLLHGRRRDLWLWGAAATLVLAFYFSGYERPDPNASIPSAMRWETVAYALNLLGSGPAFAQPGASLALGVVGTASAVAFALFGKPRSNLPLSLLLVFVLASIGANAVGRASLGGPNYALQSPRYQFFSCVFWAVSALAWSEHWRAQPRGRAALAAATLASLAFSLTSFAVYQDEVERVSQRLRRGMLAWTTHGRGLVHPDPARANAILTRAVESGVYVVPIDELLTTTPIEAAPAEPERKPPPRPAR
jgi:hypothetical protein